MAMAAEPQAAATDWGEPRQGGVVHRSFRAVTVAKTDDTESGADGDGTRGASRADAGDDDENREVIKLPQSTHSFLFTEDVLSGPFAFALSVVIISVSCLILALFDNLSGGSPGNHLNVPANVSPEVRAAQYFSIFIALTMEEEIPTASYLLRMIPRSSVEDRLGVSYGRFVFSALVRLVIGYAFLFNTFLVLAQSERVLDIMYDMLALQFVSLLDDIAFQLARYDIFGKRLRLAASAKCFRAEFERKPYRYRKKMTRFVKFLYVFNLLSFLGGMIAVTVMQKSGRFQCDSVTVTFGQDVWEHAWAETSPGQLEEM